ncbi:DUF2007 domain-containing protein [Lacimicrobium alkaliphilum]|uniref:DUF2007 domain-containing protein n=1 Tax=Lacimicrobium alkaliphilum TaxID=1526571 RepID=A0A0U3AZQ2_9ALTE|nr:DUF2007 domain-containing protein [Lacimicrobium alkaliphilum]ALS99583.1 hypothetical protein AT746_15835 [Lacimicrobium alkaliphilum]
MIKVYSNEDRFLVQQIKDMLESNGIPCFIKNEFAIGGAGDLSPFDCWPEVWIIDNDWQTKAEQVIEGVKSDPQQGRDWCCKKCGETNAGSFGICWSCGAQAPQHD